MSNKITNYQGLIGKTIEKIEDYESDVQITFSDKSTAILTGHRDGDITLCTYTGKDQFEYHLEPDVYGQITSK